MTPRVLAHVLLRVAGILLFMYHAPAFVSWCISTVGWISRERNGDVWDTVLYLASSLAYYIIVLGFPLYLVFRGRMAVWLCVRGLEQPSPEPATPSEVS